MRSIIDIYEGVLSDIEDNLSKDAKTEIYKVPSVKDFQKSPYNYAMWMIGWDLSNIIDEYKQKYPKLLIKDWNYLQFVIMKDIGKKYAIAIYYSEEKDSTSKKSRLMGWEEVTPYSIRQCKRWVIKLIEHLANNPTALDELFKHSDKMRNEGPFCQNIPLSKLLY